MFGNSLLVSIPGAALGALQLPGSLFAWRDLRDAPLRPELRLALLLVMHATAAARIRVRFLARPEMFTHGPARAWLDARLGDTQDHLILSDGETLRALPGLRNHLFFHARGLPVQEAALCRLLKLAPELFAGLAGQVNGALSFRLGARWIRPPLTTLRFTATPEIEPPLVAPFLCHAGDPLRAAAFCAEAAAEPQDAPPLDAAPHYIPLSGSALADRPFLDDLARQLQRAALGAAPPMLLGLPPAESQDAELAERIVDVLRALAATRLPFPHAPSWQLRFTTAPPTAAALAGGMVTLHPGTAFWRLGADLFDGQARVQVSGGGALGPFRALLAAWLGREVTLLRPATDGPPVTIGSAP
ncbi:hypothetical protein [Falsiroseomonas sp.]|uniref:hypothetical protein n=1 Tax=Falsiroseomonas sp. TaxID=2870721 RepID=UPI00356B4C4A